MLSSLPEIQKRQKEVFRLDFSELGTVEERQELYLRIIDEYVNLRLRANMTRMLEEAFYA